jgi:hypothetical protein
VVTLFICTTVIALVAGAELFSLAEGLVSLRSNQNSRLDASVFMASAALIILGMTCDLTDGLAFNRFTLSYGQL